MAANSAKIDDCHTRTHTPLQVSPSLHNLDNEPYPYSTTYYSTFPPCLCSTTARATSPPPSPIFTSLHSSITPLLASAVPSAHTSDLLLTTFGRNDRLCKGRCAILEFTRIPRLRAAVFLSPTTAHRVTARTDSKGPDCGGPRTN